MPNETHPTLENCDCCALRDELRQRGAEQQSGDLTTKNVRPLGSFDSKSIHRQLIKKESLDYGVADRKLVYGNDDREDLYQVTDAEINHRADSVLALIDMSKVSDNNDGTSTISTVRFAAAQRLCDSERYGEQPTGPHCSGFLVAADIVATAGHCVDNNNLARTRFFFGFRMINKDQPRLVIPTDDIYEGVAIIDRKLDNSNGSDYALVKLDRPVKDHPLVNLRRNGKIADDANVYVIGHPSGLPLKFADGAFVRDNSNAVFFEANLDTYGGNSGSPVFNQDSGDVEGILVRGDTDFVSNGSCRVSNVCPIDGCSGESVTRTAEFVEQVPLAQPPAVPDQDLDSRVSNIEAQLQRIVQTLSEIKGKLPDQ